MRIINHVSSAGGYDPQVFNIFDVLPVSVNIAVWDLVDGQNTEMMLSSSGCYAIGNTGYWGWSIEHLPFRESRKKYQYYYRMTSNEGEEQYGEFFVTVPEHGRWSHPN